MEYYGNLNNKRLMEISSYGLDDIMDKTTPIGFIHKNGMFFDFILNWFNNGTVYIPKWVPDEIFDKKRVSVAVTPKDVKKSIIWDDCWKNMKKIKRNKVNYYIGEFNSSRIGSQRSGDSYYGVFMELPRIDNDETFTWKYNDKYDTKEAVIKGDVFSFEIIVKPNGNAVIDVRYTKCENKHRNNVTLAQIDVYNASNEDILDAIKKWKSGMIQDLRAA